MKYKKEQAKLSPNSTQNELSKSMQPRGRKKCNNLQQNAIERLMSHTASYCPTQENNIEKLSYPAPLDNTFTSANSVHLF